MIIERVTMKQSQIRSYILDAVQRITSFGVQLHTTPPAGPGAAVSLWLPVQAPPA